MGIINSQPQSARRLPADFRAADRMYTYVLLRTYVSVENS